MNYRIFITGSGLAEEARQLLIEEKCVVEVGDPRDTPADLAGKLKKFDPQALIVRQGKITREVQEAAKNLKVICRHGVGTDNIDIEAATRRGIPVLFVPRANTESAAEHALALILSLMRRIPAQDRRLRSGIFEKKDYDGQELSAKTLGLVGFGRIGRRLSELVAPMSMNVLVVDPACAIEQPAPHVTRARSLEELFSRADIISLHCPLTPETKGLINRRTLAQTKAGVFIVNTARGGIINEADLLEALRDGRVRGAALDVFEAEPPAAPNPLWSMENVICTPHVAGMSDQSFRNMGLEAVRNVLAALKGEPIDPDAFVNKEAAAGPVR